MPALFLSEDDVRELADIDLALDTVERAFAALAEGTAHNIPRRRAKSPGIWLHGMHASAEYLGVSGWKFYTTTKHEAKFHVGLYDNKSGELIAMIEADELGRLRTGAASGVATEAMARLDASVVGLFGTGRQARTQLQAVCKVRKIERVEVYSRNAERCAQFAEEMSELCVTEVVSVHRPDEAAADKDIIITASSAKTPVFDGRVLVDGTHLNIIGSNSLQKTEVDAVTVQQADHIVCDSIEACQLEAGDFQEALQLGMTDWRLMHDLADVVSGQQTGRATPEDITLFKSVGLAIEDVALAKAIYDRAQSENVGQQLPF